MSTAYPCSMCGGSCKSASRCKELGVPPDGFYKPAPGQHQHDEDCEDAIPGCYKQREDYNDESAQIAQLKYAYIKWFNKI